MDTSDPVTTETLTAHEALCACGKNPEACAMTKCAAKLAQAAPAPEAVTVPATPATPSTATANDPSATLATILAGLPKDKLPALVDMFARLGAVPANGVADTGGGAVKADTNKPSLTLIPSSALFGMGRVLDFGAKKYARDNWRKGMDWTRLLDALLRHTMAVVDGEDTDPETGLPHVYHAMCCLAFLGEYQAKGLGRDDRYKGEAK